MSSYLRDTTLETVGFLFLHEPAIAPAGEFSERQAYRDTVLVGRLRVAIQRLNPNIPADAGEQAFREVLRVNSPELLTKNEAFYHLPVQGETKLLKRKISPCA